MYENSVKIIFNAVFDIDILRRSLVYSHLKSTYAYKFLLFLLLLHYIEYKRKSSLLLLINVSLSILELLR